MVVIFVKGRNEVNDQKRIERLGKWQQIHNDNVG